MDPRRTVAWIVVAGLLVGGCASATPATPVATVLPTEGPGASPTAAAVATPRTGMIADSFDIGGYKLYLLCQGSGSPTVILEAGLGSGTSVWSSVQDKLSESTRVCSYSRAGIAPSGAHPRGTFKKEGVSAGFMVDDTWKLLQAAGVSGPYVMVGHSFGGMLVRLFAFRHPEETAGVVLVDASSGHQFEGDWAADDGAWADGATLVDRATSATELQSVTSLGSMPLVVLTQSDMNGQFEIDWSHFQDELATLSTNALHMVAYPSGHMIMRDQETLLEESVMAVVGSAGAHAALPACAPRFSALHARCLESTMTAQLAAWDAERAAVKPSAGAFPSGTYVETLTPADFLKVTGRPADFARVVNTWQFSGGKFSVSSVVDGGAPQLFKGIYSAAGKVLTLVVPLDWKSAQTSGVYHLPWTRDGSGTIHFEQDGAWPPEPDFAVPYVRTGPAS